MPRANLNFAQTASELRKLVGRRICVSFGFVDRGAWFAGYAGWLTRLDADYGDSTEPLVYTLAIRDNRDDERSCKEAGFGCLVLTRADFVVARDQWFGEDLFHLVIHYGCLDVIVAISDKDSPVAGIA